MERTEDTGRYEGWSLLELMGHRQVAGMVREVELAGAPMLRVDVPSADGEGWQATQFYGPSAIYCLTPTTQEAVLRFVRAALRPAPVPWPMLAQMKEEPADSEIFTWMDDE